MRVLDYLVEQLKQINGQAFSPPEKGFFPSYTFQTDIANNSVRGFRFLGEINDFPFIMSILERTLFQHNPGGLIYKTYLCVVRAYVYDEEGYTLDQMEDLAEDIEQVATSLRDTNTSDWCIVDSRVTNIQTDEGLMAPYGVLDMNISITTEETTL